MPKFMNNKYLLNLQLFAEGTEEDTAEDGGDGDDQDEEDTSDEDGDDKPKYTQKDLDKAVAKVIAKERAKADRAAKRKEVKEKGESSEGKEKDDSKLKEAENRALKAETRAACLEAGVSKDAIDDVTALAHAYMAADESLDLEDAIEKVVKKYPHFKKSAAVEEDEEEKEEPKKKTWAERQSGRGAKKLSGVEKHFYALNPDLK